MATAERKRSGTTELTKRVLVHCLGVGGASAMVLYRQSWYSETLRDRPGLLVLGVVFWLVMTGTLSWTMWEFIIPSFLSARA